jgi:hypothetical protein
MTSNVTKKRTCLKYAHISLTSILDSRRSDFTSRRESPAPIQQDAMCESRSSLHYISDSGKTLVDFRVVTD